MQSTPTAIGYIRVSTEEQAQGGVSLEAQRAKVAAYCGLHGPELARTYADEGISGKRADSTGKIQKRLYAEGLKPRNGWHWHPTVLLKVAGRANVHFA